MGVGLNGIGRLSKDLEGFLETLYSFTNLSPAAIDIARGLSRQQQIYFETRATKTSNAERKIDKDRHEKDDGEK